MELCLLWEWHEEVSRARASSSACSNDLRHSSAAVMVLTAVTEEDTEAWRLELATTELCWARMVCGLGAGVAVSATSWSKALSTSYLAPHCSWCSRMSAGVFQPGTDTWLWLVCCCCTVSCLKLLSIVEEDCWV